MSNTQETSSTGNTCAPRQFGRVKWFNNKTGYGFITLTENGTDSDIFVHHSGVQVNNEQYKYLVQGEYVEFTLDKVENGTHAFQATHVSGIRGGKLMCETRNQNKELRTQYAKTNENPRARGSGPREELFASNDSNANTNTHVHTHTQSSSLSKPNLDKDWKVIGKELAPKSRGRPRKNNNASPETKV
jgi:cold shock CspA family protein